MMIQHNIEGGIDLVNDENQIIKTMNQEQLKAIKNLNLLSVKEIITKFEKDENNSATSDPDSTNRTTRELRQLQRGKRMD